MLTDGTLLKQGISNLSSTIFKRQGQTWQNLDKEVGMLESIELFSINHQWQGLHVFRAIWVRNPEGTNPTSSELLYVTHYETPDEYTKRSERIYSVRLEREQDDGAKRDTKIRKVVELQKEIKTVKRGSTEYVEIESRLVKAFEMVKYYELKYMKDIDWGQFME